MEGKDIKLLHTASVFEIEPLREMLEDNGISSMVRDEFAEGVNAGFVGGVSDEIDLYVLSTDYTEAKKLLNEILKAR